ncbi:hypothetical protein ROLI_024940 [Roseobacter fucihabitans]|uniref:Uncharacterized protein n=1 Tax=Roseobacter fucihabitans TaxID=1537242 RepID=A0ABZ2BTS6_9RHOB|nr:hypothetical protein [Roseobacter litoralis]MBC6965202.1 hypothetical protein [Roseobacter litoralis]
MHMNGAITRIGVDTLPTLLFRPMAATVEREVKEAMEAVGARG